MRYLVHFLVVLLLAGCAGGGVPPVSERSRATNTTARATDYAVVAGDTLYSIAWRHQWDFRKLAALNNIRPPYDIYPGQRLQVQGKSKARNATKTPGARIATTRPANAQRPAQTKSRRQTPAPNSTPHPLASTTTKPQAGKSSTTRQGSAVSRLPAATRPAASQSAAKSPAAPAVSGNGPVKLRWPGKGKRLVGFGQTRAGSSLPSNSVDLQLAPGASIRAAAAGEVVYVGQTLAGFEQFVIVKHNDTWLSAYGFNAPANVREKQRLASGAVLAVVGPSAGGRAAGREGELHFEVRKNGAPVNPAGVIK